MEQLGYSFSIANYSICPYSISWQCITIIEIYQTKKLDFFMN